MGRPKLKHFVTKQDLLFEVNFTESRIDRRVRREVRQAGSELTLGRLGITVPAGVDLLTNLPHRVLREQFAVVRPYMDLTYNDAYLAFRFPDAPDVHYVQHGKYGTEAFGSRGFMRPTTTLAIYTPRELISLKSRWDGMPEAWVPAEDPAECVPPWDESYWR